MHPCRDALSAAMVADEAKHHAEVELRALRHRIRVVREKLEQLNEQLDALIASLRET